MRWNVLAASGGRRVVQKPEMCRWISNGLITSGDDDARDAVSRPTGPPCQSRKQLTRVRSWLDLEGRGLICVIKTAVICLLADGPAGEEQQAVLSHDRGWRSGSLGVASARRVRVSPSFAPAASLPILMPMRTHNASCSPAQSIRQRLHGRRIYCRRRSLRFSSSRCRRRGSSPCARPRSRACRGAWRPGQQQKRPSQQASRGPWRGRTRKLHASGERERVAKGCCRTTNAGAEAGLGRRSSRLEGSARESAEGRKAYDEMPWIWRETSERHDWACAESGWWLMVELVREGRGRAPRCWRWARIERGVTSSSRPPTCDMFPSSFFLQPHNSRVAWRK